MAEENKKWWEKILESNWLKLTFLIPIGVAIYLFLINKPDLRFEILSNTEVLTVKEDISALQIIYDGKDLKKEGKNISVIILKISNEGYEGIKEGFYSSIAPLGFEIINGEIIGTPELIEVHDKSFSFPIDSISKSRIIFKNLIINSGDFFIIKFRTLNNINEIPEILPFGKISGIDKVNIINNYDKKGIKWQNYYWLVVIFLIINIGYYVLRDRIEDKRLERVLRLVKEKDVDKPISKKNLIVKGKIIGEDNSELIGASILCEGTAFGTVTDINGSFSINLYDRENNYLIISYVDYETKKIQIQAPKDREVLDLGEVIMKEKKEKKEKK